MSRLVPWLIVTGHSVFSQIVRHATPSAVVSSRTPGVGQDHTRTHLQAQKVQVSANPASRAALSVRGG